MITRKYNKRFTDSELNAYLQNIQAITGHQTAQVDEAWRTLGYINASAFKGYGALSDCQAAYNRKVYHTKEQAIVILAQHTDNISSWGNVLYIRTLDGIQISFHNGSSFLNRSEAIDAVLEDCRIETEWDGVINSYTYTDINAYNEARAEYQRKVREDEEKKRRNVELIHAEIQKFFAHHTTRKAYGLPVKKADWQSLCSSAMSQKCYASVEIAIRSYGVEYYDKVSRVERVINTNLPKGWDKYNFND